MAPPERIKLDHTGEQVVNARGEIQWLYSLSAGNGEAPRAIPRIIGYEPRCDWLTTRTDKAEPEILGASLAPPVGYRRPGGWLPCAGPFQPVAAGALPEVLESYVAPTSDAGSQSPFLPITHDAAPVPFNQPPERLFRNSPDA